MSWSSYRVATWTQVRFDPWDDVRGWRYSLTMFRYLRYVIGGFLMGAADVVPGVSGGTIALVIGVYERLVASIREGSKALTALLRLDFGGFRERLGRVDWSLLISLGLGIVIAVASLAALIERLLHDEPTVMAGFFMGLVVGSVIIAWRLLTHPEPKHWLVAGGVGIVLFVLLGLGGQSDAAAPSLLAFFGAAALAVCAMILPGISGSLILLLIGMYEPVLGVVADRDWGTLAVLVLGATVGLALFSRLLNWALGRHREVMLAGLVGLMAGSLRVLWPWPGGVEDSALGAPGADVWNVAFWLVVGLALVFAVSRLAEKPVASEFEPAP